jgi:uncharacterized protein YaiI (UPF0178 family)
MGIAAILILAVRAWGVETGAIVVTNDLILAKDAVLAKRIIVRANLILYRLDRRSDG